MSINRNCARTNPVLISAGGNRTVRRCPGLSSLSYVADYAPDTLDSELLPLPYVLNS